MMNDIGGVAGTLAIYSFSHSVSNDEFNIKEKSFSKTGCNRAFQWLNFNSVIGKIESNWKK